MKKFNIDVSVNGWEYTGYYKVKCEKNVKRVEGSEEKILIDDKIEIDFGEEVGAIEEIN
ncbi:hypothetical protein [Paraclostridium tenue]|uniref:Uncharacterized protein n=1 Tax=Paraclostridium tenue TaxID=1737 RepID=A0ABN1M9B9_9FIRM